MYLSPTGHFKRDDRLSIERSLFDTRDFSQMLSDWISHELGEEKVHDPMQRFLKKTGLSHWITAEEFNPIVSGQAVPGRNFALLLSLHLPGHVLRRSAEPLPNIGPIKFRNKAAYWLTSNTGTSARQPIPRISSVTDLSNERFDAFRLHVLRKFAALSTVDASAGMEEKMDKAEASNPQKNTQIIDGVIARLISIRETAFEEAPNISSDTEEIREALEAQCKKSPKLVRDYLSDMGFPNAQIQQFLTAFAAHYTPVTQYDLHPAAQALAFLRHSQNPSLSQQKLAERLEILQKTISEQENGISPIRLKYIGALVSTLRLSDDMAEQFILIIKPDIVPATLPEWLGDKIKAKAWDHIAYPALDKAWLSQQPPVDHARLLLKTFREEHSLTQLQLANKLKVHRSQINDWESGISPIRLKNLCTLVSALNITDDRVEQIILAIKPDIVPATLPEWLRDKIKAKAWDHIAYPALDKAWLSQQPPADHARLLLKALREKANLTHDALAKKLGISRQRIQWWENGKISVNSQYIPALASAFNKEEQELKDTIELSKHARRMEQNIRTQIAVIAPIRKYPQLAPPANSKSRS